MIVLQNFNKIIGKFNASFLEKFIFKIKLFLKNQPNTNDNDFTFCCIANLIKNINQYFKDDQEKENKLQLNELIKDLFFFICEEFEYDYLKPNQVFFFSNLKVLTKYIIILFLLKS